MSFEDLGNGQTASWNDDEILTDEELAAGGIIKTVAYVRRERTKNAKRVATAKAKAARDQDVKQLNVRAKSDAMDYLKSVAKASVEGRAWPLPPSLSEATEIGMAALALTGIRRRIVMILLGKGASSRA